MRKHYWQEVRVIREQKSRRRLLIQSPKQDKCMQKTAFCGWPARGSNRRITKTLMVMKLMMVLLTAALMNVSAKGISQNVSYSGKDVPLEKVFSEVRKQTGYVFVYDESVLEHIKTVSIRAVNMPVADFLTLLLRDLPIKYT